MKKRNLLIEQWNGLSHGFNGNYNLNIPYSNSSFLVSVTATSSSSTANITCWGIAINTKQFRGYVDRSSGCFRTWGY